MTAPETSLARWSRLKRETVSKGQAGADQDDRRARSAGPANSEPEAGSDEIRKICRRSTTSRSIPIFVPCSKAGCLPN
jgi:hypothetical protein